MASGQGDEFLARNGFRTRTARPKITFVPTIFFNGRYNQTLQDLSEKEFKKVVCELLAFRPIGCRKTDPNIQLII